MVIFTQPSHLCEVCSQGDGNTFRLWVYISLSSACRADIACSLNSFMVNCSLNLFFLASILIGRQSTMVGKV